MTLELSRQKFLKILNTNFTKIRPVGSELFHADKQTDVQMLIVALVILITRLKIEFSHRGKNVRLYHKCQLANAL